MDGNRFDQLTRTLVEARTRRGVLKAAVGGAVAAVGVTLGLRPAEAAPNRCAVGCAGLPGPQKAACKQACRKCRGNFDRVCTQFGPFGPTAFVCCAEGTVCDQFIGACIEVVTCPTGEPAESCVAGITTNCGEAGACALVEAAGGGNCQCVERFCTEIPCASDADCADSGGVCATIPGCCAVTTFCAVPCGSAATTTITGNGGWQR